MNPLAAVVTRGASGAAVGSLEHVGIKDDYIKESGEKTQPGGSILFIMEHEVTTSSVFHEMKNYDSKVSKTTFE